MTDVMVDIETTHTDPDAGGIIQLSAIKFNLATGEVGDSFNRFPALLPKRTWSESTREFWQLKNREVYLGIIRQQEQDYEAVYRDFVKWVLSEPTGDERPGPTFWAKPLKFDWPFIESQYLQLGLSMPFAHWNVMDVHSYIAGLRGAPMKTKIEDELPFNGTKHNALHDAGWQIDLLHLAQSTHVTATVVV